MTVEGIELIEDICIVLDTVLGIVCEIPEVDDGNIKGGEIVVDFSSFFPNICPIKNSFSELRLFDDFDEFPFTSDGDMAT